MKSLGPPTPLDQGDDVDKDPTYAINAQEIQTAIQDALDDAEDEGEIIHNRVQIAVDAAQDVFSDEVIANSVGSESDVYINSQFLGTSGFYGNTVKKPPPKKAVPTNIPTTRGKSLLNRVTAKKKTIETKTTKNETKNIKDRKKDETNSKKVTEKRNSSKKSVAERTSSTNSKDKCNQKSETGSRYENRTATFSDKEMRIKASQKLIQEHKESNETAKRSADTSPEVRKKIYFMDYFV